MQPLNFIYIHSHDTGRYVQPYGHALDTPNLQRLAERGVLFRQAFCAAPTCSPSRAALLTGQSPHSVGMLGLEHRGHRLRSVNDHIIHTLHAHGYTSALSGLQHIAGSGQEIGYHQVLPNNGDTYLTQSAVDYLHQPHDMPFFLDVGFNRTHRTGQDSEGNQWHNRSDQVLGDPRYVRPPAPLPDTPRTRADFADFGACVHELDRLMGQVFDAVDAAGLADRTVILATTDHGIAYPGCKCNLTDHGIGVMLILRGPERLGLAGGKVIDAMVSQIDLFPTICQLVGIAPPSRLEGRSLLPLLRGDAEQVNEQVFAEVTHHAAYEPMRAVRTQRWKYIRRFDDTFDRTVLPNVDNSASKRLWADHGWAQRRAPRESLYDLIFDPNEACNLADSSDNAAVLQDMRTRLELWQHRTDDPILRGSLADLPGIVRTPQSAYSPR